MTAKAAFLTLAALGLGAGFGLGMLYYGGQVAALKEQLNTKDGQIARYRVALGIDPASKGALVELNNQELALKAQAIVAKLREFNFDLDAKLKVIHEQRVAKKIDEHQALKDSRAAMQQVSDAFDANLASDAFNVEGELRKRMDPAAISHVVRVPAFIADGSRVTFLALMRGSSSNAFYIRGFADEMEQMAKLLPPDSPKR